MIIFVGIYVGMLLENMSKSYPQDGSRKGEFGPGVGF